MIDNQLLNTLANIINNENKSSPLKNREIKDILNRKGYKVTLEKIQELRDELGILSYRDRKVDFLDQIDIFNNTQKKPKKIPIRQGNESEYFWFYLHLIRRDNDIAMAFGITTKPVERGKRYNSSLNNGWKIDKLYALKFLGNNENVKYVEKTILKIYKPFTSYLSKSDIREGYTETIKYDKKTFEEIYQLCLEKI